MNKLLIVESPAKCKVIQSYLGGEFKVIASYGHIRTLKKTISAVDCKNQFEMDFIVPADKKQQLQTLAKAVMKTSHVYIATDFDREGEAIGWSIQELLKKEIGNKPVERITFTEITEQAIKQALKQPRKLDLALIAAYKARTIIDFLVGFHLSPLVWSAIPNALSIGRVQSPALKLIALRDQEINKFEAKPYWIIETDYNGYKPELKIYNQKEVSQFTFTDENSSNSAVNILKSEAQELYQYKQTSNNVTIKSPDPFVTATLQQQAINKFHFSSQEVMSVAQKLYEGVNIRGIITPLITYMRTDSKVISAQAVKQIEQYLIDQNLTFKQRLFRKNKDITAQEAHEAIRPVKIMITPESIKSELSQDQYKLYSLIWHNTVSAYMPSARYRIDTYTFSTINQKHLFTLQQRILVEAGWQKWQVNTEEQHTPIPNRIQLKEIISRATSTKPPAKITESSLIKNLEKLRIGRPSTYSYIIDTITKRNYVVNNKQVFTATQIGYQLLTFIEEKFSNYVDFNFTAKLEKQLDDIAKGRDNYIEVVNNFWLDLSAKITDYLLSRKSNCCTCQTKLLATLGRRGWYTTCPNKCSITKDITIISGRICALCGSNMTVRTNKANGEKFCGCLNFPKCRYGEPYDLNQSQACPKCQIGWLVKRTYAKKTFLSCNLYPKCDGKIDISQESEHSK